MDKYEYKLKLEQLKSLVESKDYETAAEIADSINWRKVKSSATLFMVGEIYDRNKRYEESHEILLMAYDRAAVGRNILYRLTLVSLKMGNVEEAKEHYEEFLEVAPYDNQKYILRYQIAKLSGAQLPELIGILEEFKSREYTEEWAFELAYLYHRFGDGGRCVEVCDELVLWFGDGKYVEKALELKMIYQPLTQEQEDKYRQFKQFRDGIVEVRPTDMLESGEIIQETVKIPNLAVGSGRFNTSNLQAEIAKSMQQIMDANSKESVSDTMDNIKKMVEEIPYLQAAAEEEEPVVEEGVYGYIETDEEIDGSLKNDFEELLAEDRDGQVYMSVQGGMVREPQVNGQMEIEDVLAEWERTRQAAEAAMATAQERRLVSAKVRALQEAQELLERLNEIIPKLEAGATPQELLAERYLQNVPQYGSQWQQAEGQTQYQEEFPMSQEQGDWQYGQETVPEEAWQYGQEPVREEAWLYEQEVVQEEPWQHEKEAVEESWQYGQEPGFETVPEEPWDYEQEPGPKAVEESWQHGQDAVEESWQYEQKPGQKPVREESWQHGQEAIEEEAWGYEQESKPVQEEFWTKEQQPSPEAESGESLSKETLSLSEAGQMPKERQITRAGAVSEDISLQKEIKGGKEHLAQTDVSEAEHLSKPEVRQDSQRNPSPSLDTDKLSSWEEAARILGESMPEEYLAEMKRESERKKREARKSKLNNSSKKFSSKEQDQPKPIESLEKLIEQQAVQDTESQEENDAGKYLQSVFQAAKESREKKAELPKIQIEEPEEHIRKLSEEQKEIFSYFVPITGMEQQLCQVLEGALNRKEKDHSSSSGNILITGGRGSGKTVLATDLIKAIQRMEKHSRGKVGKITGETLNQKDLPQLMKAVAGGYLIIEKAGQISKETATRLSLLMEQDTKGLLVIMEDTRKGIDKALGQDMNFARKFTERIKIPVFTSDELVEFAKAYAAEQECEIDDMGILALYNRISNIQKLDEATTLTEVKEIMDQAIHSAERGGLKKLFGGKKFSPEGYLYLREKDFEE